MKTSNLLLMATGIILSGVAAYLVVKRISNETTKNGFFNRLGDEIPQSHIRGIMHKAKMKAAQPSLG